MRKGCERKRERKIKTKLAVGRRSRQSAIKRPPLPKHFRNVSGFEVSYQTKENKK
jgi:hypothetical protein